MRPDVPEPRLGYTPRATAQSPGGGSIVILSIFDYSQVTRLRHSPPVPYCFNVTYEAYRGASLVSLDGYRIFPLLHQSSAISAQKRLRR
jgi:hypothetical protein